jgi:hypothetical protein
LAFSSLFFRYRLRWVMQVNEVRNWKDRHSIFFKILFWYLSFSLMKSMKMLNSKIFRLWLLHFIRSLASSISERTTIWNWKCSDISSFVVLHSRQTAYHFMIFKIKGIPFYFKNLICFRNAHPFSNTWYYILKCYVIYL